MTVALLLGMCLHEVAQACQPRDHGPESSIGYSDVVFLGRVVERTEERLELREDRACKVFKYRFKVSRGWKGVSDEEISVYGVQSCDMPVPPPGLNCELLDWGEFEVGPAYLVYASYRNYDGSEGDTLFAWLGVAGSSKPASEATQEMRELSVLLPNSVEPGMPKAGGAATVWLYVGLLGCALSGVGLVLRGCACYGRRR
jgi:hypothetical protein